MRRPRQVPRGRAAWCRHRWIASLRPRAARRLRAAAACGRGRAGPRSEPEGCEEPLRRVEKRGGRMGEAQAKPWFDPAAWWRGPVPRVRCVLTTLGPQRVSGTQVAVQWAGIGLLCERRSALLRVLDVPGLSCGCGRVFARQHVLQPGRQPSVYLHVLFVLFETVCMHL